MSLLAIDMGSSSCKGWSMRSMVEFSAKPASLHSKVPAPSWAELSPELLAGVSPRDPSPRRHCHRRSHRSARDQLSWRDLCFRGSPQPAASAAILNMDNRAAAQADRLKKTLDPKQAFEITAW